jgi:sulfate transport system substrate-binding protein
MNLEILPAFQAHWKEKTGEKLEFITAYAGSGIIVDRILKEFTPEVAILSSEIDALRLARAGAVSGTLWRDLPHRGVVSRSPLVLICRSGNPLGIARFRDLAGEGVRLIHPDPATSGCGVWSLVAVHADAAEPGNGKSARQALLSVWKNVVEEPSSARAALQAFEEGRGNVLVTYEQQGLERAASGKPPGEVIYPVPTVMSEHIVLQVPRNIDSGDRALVDAFIAFLWSDASQDMFLAHGFRSVNEEKNRDRVPVSALTLENLGGAREAGRRIVEVWSETVLPVLADPGDGDR